MLNTVYTFNTQRLSTCIAYDPADAKLIKALEKHLRPLIRSGRIGFDPEILPGAETNSVIQTRLENADIILLMVSPDAMNSDYFWNTEMLTAHARHLKGEAVVIPVLLRACDWKSIIPLSSLQVLPRSEKPVTSWDNRDEAFTDIATEINRFAQKLTDKKERIKQYIEHTENFLGNRVSITPEDSQNLSAYQQKLGLTDDEANNIKDKAIEKNKIKLKVEYSKRKQRYEDIFKAILEGNNITPSDRDFLYKKIMNLGLTTTKREIKIGPFKYNFGLGSSMRNFNVYIICFLIVTAGTFLPASLRADKAFKPVSSKNSYLQEIYPKAQCGDDTSRIARGIPVDMYPIFVDRKDDSVLKEIQTNLCRDAFRNRENGMIQVASFMSKDKANEFRSFMETKFGHAEVGAVRSRTPNK